MTVHVNEEMVDTLCRLVEGKLPFACEGVGGGQIVFPEVWMCFNALSQLGPEEYDAADAVVQKRLGDGKGLSSVIEEYVPQIVSLILAMLRTGGLSFDTVFENACSVLSFVTLAEGDMRGYDTSDTELLGFILSAQISECADPVQIAYLKSMQRCVWKSPTLAEELFRGTCESYEYSDYIEALKLKRTS
ncbi:MAG: hypothetical protein HGB18_04395 [Candidatus Moranbacteria bacterium]|nr:hypothetical protein [Candidatus Moranbacteria bacterium]